MADIGEDDPKIIEFEPIPESVPAAPTPAPKPEPVPA